MQRYFKKEIPESPVFVSGHPLRFDLLETSDPMLIAELDKCVARQVGGVISITKEEYESESKKKEIWTQSKPNSMPQHRQELSALRLDARRVVEAVGNPSPKIGQFARSQVPPAHDQFQAQAMPEPIEVPSPESFVVKPPPTARPPKSKI